MHNETERGNEEVVAVPKEINKTASSSSSDEPAKPADKPAVKAASPAKPAAKAASPAKPASSSSSLDSDEPAKPVAVAKAASNSSSSDPDEAAKPVANASFRLARASAAVAKAASSSSSSDSDEPDKSAAAPATGRDDQSWRNQKLKKLESKQYPQLISIEGVFRGLAGGC